MKRSLLIALLCGLLCLQACRRSASDSDDAGPQQPVSVEVASPRLGTVIEHIGADAVLAPLTEAVLSARISAPVTRFYVQRGSHVRAGQLLATLEHRDLAAAVADARGSAVAAQAAFDAAQGAQIPEEMQRSRLDVQQAESTLRLNQSIVAAREQLLKEGAIPGRDLDTARAALLQAQAAYDVAAEHLRAQERVSREAALAEARGAAESANGRYANAEAQAGYSEIRSPIAGVVTDRPLFAGETAGAGAPLLTVMDTSSLLAKLHLPQQQAQRLTAGGRAQVTVPGMEQPVTGTISLISPALDPGSSTVEVWVRLANADGALKTGTAVHVALEGSTARNAVVIPAAALLPGEQGSRYVLLAGSDGAAHKRPVAVGILDGEEAQITSGLSPRDRIVVGGGYGLDNGTKIKAEAPGEGKADAPAVKGGSQ